MAARPIRRFLELVGMLDRGAFAQACDAELTKAIDALEALPTEKGKATLTLTIDINFEKGRVDVMPKLAAKVPGYSPGRTPFWTADGALSVEHPQQIDMFGPRETKRESETA